MLEAKRNKWAPFKKGMLVSLKASALERHPDVLLTQLVIVLEPLDGYVDVLAADDNVYVVSTKDLKLSDNSN